MSRITIKQIAELAGVSIGTVDRVLHNRGEVSEKTKRRIEEICKEYDYKSNKIGKAMAMQRTHNNIAVILKEESFNHYNYLVHVGIKNIIDETRDYNLRFNKYSLEDSTEEEYLSILDTIEDEKLSGIIIRMIQSQKVVDKLNHFSEAKKVPIVTCTTDDERVHRLGFIGQNHHKEGRTVANLLCRMADEPLKILVVVSRLQSSSRGTKLNSFLDYMKNSTYPYEVVDIVEVDDEKEDLASDIQKYFAKKGKVNAVYLHNTDIERSLNILYQEFKYQGICFSYGDKDTLKPFIENGMLDFAIYESPSQHGYLSGKLLFDHLMNGTIPDSKVNELEGIIAIKENC